LLNLDPSVRLRTPGGLPLPFRVVAEDSDLESLVGIAVRARPELIARSAEIQETLTRVSQERVRPWLPLVSVGYSAGGFGGGSNLVADDFGPLQGRSDLAVMAVWTIQNLGVGNHARVRRAGAVVGQAMAGYEGTVNQVRREVAEAQAGARTAVRQVEAAAASLGVAEEGFRLETERIRKGQGRPIEALDSFRQLLDARLELLRGIVAFDIAQFQLFVALGSNPVFGLDPECNGMLLHPSPDPQREAR
jgi:outer membrane protein TolC